MTSNTTRPRGQRTTTRLVAIASAAGLATAQGLAHAVTIAPNDAGQVLIYPYFTVNGGNATLLSIVNTTDQSKAIRVRFHESLNGANIFDFNLYLAPFDVWVASINPTADGAGLFTNDRSCTVPTVVGKDWNGTVPGPSSSFKPFDFAFNQPDIVGTSDVVRIDGVLTPITAADRLRQGHVEVFDMGNLVDEPAPSNFRPRSWTLHAGSIGSRVPNNCPALQMAWTGGGNPETTGQWLANRSRAVAAANGGSTGQTRVAGGGLVGNASIVDVEFGRSLSYNATALDGFFRADGLAGSSATLHFEPGISEAPTLALARTGNGGDVTAHVVTEGEIVTLNFDESNEGGLKAVSAALMSRYIYNEYNRQSALGAASEWVVTFPTKRLHTYDGWRQDTRPFSDNQDIEPPANATLADELPFDTVGLCEPITYSRWDRETYAGAGQPPVIGTPPPGGSATPSLCWNANVIAFNQSIGASDGAGVLGSTAIQGAIGLPTNEGSDDYSSGWARIEFNASGQSANTFRNYLVSDDGVASIGLPGVGFWVADYLNSNISAGIRGNYGVLHRHHWRSDGYRGVTNPPLATGTQAPPPLNAAGLGSWLGS